MWKEFKQFALRGNVIELAIAVIIGTAFSKIVDSLVNDILAPVLGLLAGGTSLKFFWSLTLMGPLFVTELFYNQPSTS